MQDLGTAVEQRLPLPIILWNNDALGQIAGDMVERGLSESIERAFSADGPTLIEVREDAPFL